MKKRRSFQAKVLGMRWGRMHAQVVRFSDIDDEYLPEDNANWSIAELIERDDEDIPKHNLADPFDCLEFVEDQVRKKHDMESVLDFHVTMTERSDEAGTKALFVDTHTVRPWKNKENGPKFAKVYKKR